MSVGGPSKYCPRCDAALPLRASQCDACGYQFLLYPDSVPQGTGSGPWYGPNAGPLPSSGFQGQPGYAPYGGYPGAPVAALPRRGGVGKVIVWLVVLALLVGGGAAAWFLYLSPSHSNSPLFDAHGVPGNVPLPNGLTFGAKSSVSQSNSAQNLTATYDEWGWQVADSDPATIAQFYREQMPGKGWGNIRSQIGKDGHQDLIGCQTTQVLVVEIGSDRVQLTDDQGKPGPKVTAPAGGSALALGLLTTNSPEVQKRFCSLAALQQFFS